MENNSNRWNPGGPKASSAERQVLPHRFENWVEAWERIREEGWHGAPRTSAPSEKPRELCIDFKHVEHIEHIEHGLLTVIAC